VRVSRVRSEYWDKGKAELSAGSHVVCAAHPTDAFDTAAIIHLADYQQ
jgi:hypothetical protein